MKSIVKWFALASGMALSFGAGYLVAKKKFDSIQDAEIEEIKQYYNQKYSEPHKEPITKPNEPIIFSSVQDEEQFVNYARDLIKRAGEPDVQDKVETNYQSMINVITPMEYGEDMSYDTVGLTYYADGVLARDDDDEMVDNIDDVVGIDSLKYLGGYEDDVLYVKNDILKTYYEVTANDQTYVEVTGRLT